MDYYGKLTGFALVSNITSATVITFLSAGKVTQRNLCLTIDYDLFRIYSSWERENILHRKSSIYYPQANGETLEKLVDCKSYWKVMEHLY